MKSAILIHLLDWSSEASRCEMEGGIALCRTEGSDVEKLYLDLCQTDNLDQGEPWSFPSHILISEVAHDDSFPYWGGPFSVRFGCLTCVNCLTGKASPLSYLAAHQFTNSDYFDVNYDRRLIETHYEVIIEAWHEHCS